VTDTVVIPFPRKPRPAPTHADRVSQMDAEWLRSFVPQIVKRDAANEETPGPEAA
jgi:hypothetical protein